MHPEHTVDIVLAGTCCSTPHLFMLSFLCVAHRSDAIQAGIMLCAYLLMPFVLLSHYPSMGELHDPCADNSTQCIAAVRPWFAQYPTVGGSCLPVNNATDSDCYRSHFVSDICVRTFDP
eukprot:m.1396426 g.1396426  ORF g.1396426 m.1396426 type:complete len:119 (+) comp24995_c0_seq31:67-423(+)